MRLDREKYIKRRVSRAVSKRREIQAAYIFGSPLTRRTRRDSDVDVAVLLARPLPPKRAFGYRLDRCSRPTFGT